MELIETLETARLVGGLFLTFTGILSVVAVWFNKRVSSVAREATNSIAVAQAEVEGKHAALVEDQDDLKAKVAQVERELARQRERLTNIEMEVRATPTREDIHNLTLAMAGMEGKMGVLEEKLTPVTAIMERMQELLMNRGKD